MKLILIGQRASGKTQIGRFISENWNCSFTDLDDLVLEKSGKSPSEWLESNQENSFRHWEFTLLKKWMDEGSGILATGGGAPLYPAALPLLKHFSPVIWLTNSLNSRLSHLQKNPRPPLKKEQNLKDEINRLDQERNYIYDYLADDCIDTDAPKEEILQKFYVLRARFDLTNQNAKK